MYDHYLYLATDRINIIRYSYNNSLLYENDTTVSSSTVTDCINNLWQIRRC